MGDESAGGSRRVRTTLGVLAIIAATAAILAIAGSALAGDAVAEFELPADEQAATAGETIEVEVWISSDGGYADEGVESYAFVLAVPPEVGEPTDVEPGPWLAQDGGAVNQTLRDVGDGVIHVRHERTGADDGVTGYDLAATVTVEVREDAPSADATVLVADPQASLQGSDYRMRSFGDEGTLVVEGGGERLEPAYEPGSDAGGDVDVRTADEQNRTVDPSDGDDGDGGGAGAMPGFGAGLALLGSLLGVSLVLALGRRSHWRE